MSGPLDSTLMHDLFRVEVRTQGQMLVSGLLMLEQEPHRADQLEACMRAAHSLKGAARLIDIGAGVIVAHAMEELFVAAQEGRVTLTRPQIDVLLKGVDLITMIGNAPATTREEEEEQEQVAERYVTALADVLTLPAAEIALPSKVPAALSDPSPASASAFNLDAPSTAATVEYGLTDRQPGSPAPPSTDRLPSERALPDAQRTMRVSAENLNRLLDLAGEALVESRRLPPLSQSFLHLKRLQKQAARSVETLRACLPPGTLDPAAQSALAATEQALLNCQQFLAERLVEIDAINHRFTALTHRLYDQALQVRMRPFADGLTALPRMVRDVGHALGKWVKLEVSGADTKVDRDILERLDAPLGHLLRNAVDHGIEPADVRAAAGKPAEGVVKVEAQHSAGTLQIIVSDDGAGIDTETIRARVIARGLVDGPTAERLSESELLEFVFLPGFTMKEQVSDISGRGVGLDVVRDMLKQVGGNVTVSSRPGNGTRFHLQLPLTLSVIRALLVEIAGETFAFSLSHILRACRIDVRDVSTIEGRQYFDLEGLPVALVEARQILGASGTAPADEGLSVVVLAGSQGTYGVVVDRFAGARELVVQPLDRRLGKIKDISAGALMEDGTPLLILDAEDMVQSMVRLTVTDRLNGVRGTGPQSPAASHRKRVLVVDDSFTVRELQRKLLAHHGYEVELAVDGMEGWNTVRSGNFDLVVSDVDMPRMDGIELVRRIKSDSKLSALPVMILSYKDREDDRRRGLDAGADYYLTKGSYQSDALIDAVVDLIGVARP